MVKNPEQSLIIPGVSELTSWSILHGARYIWTESWKKIIYTHQIDKTDGVIPGGGKAQTQEKGTE